MKNLAKLIDVELLRKYLPESEFAQITKEMGKNREIHKKYMREWRENRRETHGKPCENHGEVHRKSCENHGNSVKITNCEIHKNGEIGSKTAIFAENSREIHALGGGLGGAVHNDPIKRTGTEDDLKRTISIKEKNNKKRKENPVKITNENSAECADEFLELYRIYPRKVGKMPGLKKLEALRKKNALPPLEYLCAALELCKGQWDAEQREIDKIPYFSTWASEMRWSDFPESKVNARIAQKKALEARKLLERENPVPAPKAAPAPLKTQINAELPTQNEWLGMNGVEKLELAAKLGCAMADITTEIERRQK